MAAFRTTGAALGTLHAAFFYVYAIMQLPAGILADRIGPKRAVTGGALVLNVGAIGFALAASYWPAFIARAMIGLGGAVVFISILRFCASWFRPDEFATMNGLTIAIAGLGGILATTPLAVAAAAFGWRATTLGLGIGGLLVAGVVVLLVEDTPEEAGFEPVGDADEVRLTLETVVANLRGVLRERVTWVMSVMLFCAVGVAITLFGLWGVPYVVQTYDVSVTHASWFTLLGSVGILVGPPTFGWLSDRLQRRSQLILLGGVGYVIGFATLAITGRPPWPVVAVVYFAVGFLLGTFTLSFPLIKERHATSASGVSTATINAAGFFGAALLPTILGYALDVYWTGETIAGTRIYTLFGYRMAFAIAAAASMLALLASAWLYLSDPRA